MTNPYFINVASNFIFLSILVVGLVVHYLTKRRALLKFFRIGKTKRINLYLSHLRVSPFAAIGVDGLPRSFGGLAIPFAESRYITLFQRLFNYVVPVVASQPGLLKWLLVSDVEVVSLTSPLKEETLIPQCPEKLTYTHEQGIKARAALRSKLWSRWGEKYR